MRRSVSLTLATLALGASLASAQVQTDPVGFLTMTVKGTTGLPGGTTSAISLLGLSFTQPVSYQATLSSAAGTTLVDNNATWSDNQFNGPTNNYYVELTTGSGAGITSQITATSGPNKSITTADDLSSFVSAGTGYKIRKNWTLAALFGANDEAGLGQGTASTADQVLVLTNPATNTYATYYYKNSGLGGTGWRSTASTSTDVSTSAFFKPTDGILVRRFQSSDLSAPLAGAVKLGQTQSSIVPGINIVSNPYPSGTMTLGNSKLLESGIGQGIATTADLVQILNISTGLYDTYYYKNAGLGGTGWRSTASTSADASGTAIPFGASIIINRKVNSTFRWVAPQPFVYP